MTKWEDIRLLWSCTFGKKSEINLLGKILLSPIMLLLVCEVSILIVLFTKQSK